MGPWSGALRAAKDSTPQDDIRVKVQTYALPLGWLSPQEVCRANLAGREEEPSANL